jgi:VWFA-related protein
MARARVALVVCLVLCAVDRTPGAGDRGPQRPQFRAGTNTVPVYVTVVDREGQLVPDLTRDDFEIYDNGIRRELTVFANTPQPITIVVMLDRSGSVREHYGLVRRAAEVFVQHLLPDDRARIGSFSDGIRIAPETFTSDQTELLRILREELLETGPTPLWNATDEAIEALAGEDGRRVVLVFTDGKDAPGPVPLAKTFQLIRQRVQSEEIMVYAIGLSSTCTTTAAALPPGSADLRAQRGSIQRPPPRRPIPPRYPIPPGDPRFPIPVPRPFPPTIPGFPPIERPPFEPTTPLVTNDCRPSGPDPDLKAIAEAGGGGFFELDDAANLNETFRRVAEELHQQYLLGFDATARDGRVHRLEVRLRRPDLTARARTSYIAR